MREVLEGAAAVAVDCEAAGFHRYSDRLCLVQLSAAGRNFVLDPLAFDPGPLLGPCLEDPARRVVMHGAAYDLRLLARDLDVRVRSLADTQIAANLAGEPAVGLQALLERHLGVRLSKKFQRADWAARPLSAEMIDYAVGDTQHLHRLIALLEERLEALGRLPWALEEYEWLTRSATADEQRSAADGPAPDADPVTRFRDARRMDDRSLTALRELVRWRDRIAKAADRAPFRVAPDSALAAAAVDPPATVRELERIRGIGPRLARRHGPAAISALKRVARLPASALTPYPRPKRGKGRLDVDQMAAFERLKRARNRAGDELGIERGVLMPNHVLRRIAALGPGTRGELADMADMRRWQAEVLGDALLEVL